MRLSLACGLVVGLGLGGACDRGASNLHDAGGESQAPNGTLGPWSEPHVDAMGVDAMGATPPDASTVDLATDEGVDPAPASYFPLAVGNRWTYRVTDLRARPKDLPYLKIVTIDAREAVGGDGPNARTIAFKRSTRTAIPGIKSSSEGWWGLLAGVEGRRTVNYREIGGAKGEGEDWWEPHHLKVDESRPRTLVGAQWTERFIKNSRYYGTTVRSNEMTVWEVRGVDVPIKVPAGTFDCLVVAQIRDGYTKLFSYARGVGKVQEKTESVDLEELTEFHVAR